MPRALPAALESAMDSHVFKTYIAIGKRNYTGDPPASLSGYTTLITSILYYKYDGLDLTVKYASANLPADDGLIVGRKYYIERGVTIGGVNYTIKSASLRFDDYSVTKQIITAKFSLFSPDQKPDASPPGDQDYDAVLIELNPNGYYIGDVDFKATPENADHWDYNFYPAGKSVSLNNFASLLPLLHQKYLIHAVDNSQDGLDDGIEYFHLASPLNLTAWAQGEGLEGGVSVCYSPELNIFVMVNGKSGSSSGFYTSTDGINWDPVDDPTNATYNEVAWSPGLGLFVVVGTSRILTSPDGTTWTERTSATATNIQAVCWSPELALLIAVSSNFGGTDNIQTSPDGINWTARTHAAANFHTISWSPTLNILVAAGAGAGGKIFRSSDGITWTESSSVPGWLGSVWSPEQELFVLVGDGSGGQYIYTSTDGVSWTPRTPSAGRQWQAVEWAPSLGLFIAVCNNGVGNRSMTSPNGIDWTARSTPSDETFMDVVWSEELQTLVACAGEVTLYNMYAIAQSLTADHTITQGDITLLKDAKNHSFLWRDEASTVHTLGAIDAPVHNLGYLESTDLPPQGQSNQRGKAVVGIHLKYKSGDVFTLQINGSQSATYLARVTEIMDPNAEIGWRNEIELFERFSNTNAGPLPSTIERVAPYTPLATTSFDGNLDETINNLQALAERIDDLVLGSTTEEIQDVIGAMLTGNTETNIIVTYQDADGTIDFEIADEIIQDIVGAMLTGNTETGITVTYQDADGTIDFQVTPAVKQQMFSHGQNGTVAAGATNYINPQVFGIVGTVSQISTSVAVTVRDLTVKTNTAQPGTGSLVITLLKNAVATGLVVTIAAGSAAGTYSDTSNTVSLAAGDSFGYQIVNNAATASAAIIPVNCVLAY